MFFETYYRYQWGVFNKFMAIVQRMFSIFMNLHRFKGQGFRQKRLSSLQHCQTRCMLGETSLVQHGSFFISIQQHVTKQAALSYNGDKIFLQIVLLLLHGHRPLHSRNCSSSELLLSGCCLAWVQANCKSLERRGGRWSKKAKIF